MTEEDYRNDAVEKGFETPIRKDWEPGLLNDDHAHDVTLYLYILSGAMTVEQPVGKSTCGPGDTVVVAGGVTHREIVGSDGVSFLVAKKA